MSATKHVAMTVVSSPDATFQPGDEYTRGCIADWLEWGELPVGLVLRNGNDWTVQRGRRGKLLLRCGDDVLNADGLRLARRKGCPSGTRMRVLAAIRDLSNGKAPTYRELSEATGLSLSLLRYHTGILSAEGLLDREPWAWRALWLTEAGERVLKGGAE